MDLRQRKRSCINVPQGFIELYSNGKEEELGATLPFPMKTHDNASWNNHAYNTIKTFRSLSDAPVILVPPTYKGIMHLISAGVKIVNVSLKALDSVHYNKLAENAFIVTSAGNDAEEGETGLARNVKVCAVGAVDKNMKPQSYSSFGKGSVKTCAVTGLDYGTGILHGTSFAAPIVSGLLSQWFSWYNDKTGTFPTVKQTNQFIKQNSHDIWDDGEDLKTGHGLLRLPKSFELETLEIKIGSNIAIVKKIKEELVTEELIELMTIPKIEAGRTLVGISDIGKTSNDAILWDQNTKVAKFIRG